MRDKGKIMKNTLTVVKINSYDYRLKISFRILLVAVHGFPFSCCYTTTTTTLTLQPTERVNIINFELRNYSVRYLFHLFIFSSSLHQLCFFF